MKRQDVVLNAFKEAIHAQQIDVPCPLLDIPLGHLCLRMVRYDDAPGSRRSEFQRLTRRFF